ncbi:MAG: DUF2156 domain-containing protein [Candidatus Thermoplasmatota archaeon]|nr:DUF2156 domain-containing protein [Candidatus Thermoplasmatota archaeon]
MLSLGDFKKISLDDKPVFDTFYQKFPPEHSGELFSTMISWSHFVEYSYAVFDTSIVILSKRETDAVLHHPTGKLNQNLLKEVIAFAKREDLRFGFIKEQQKSILLKHFPSLNMVENRDFFDYIYRSSDLADLPGTKYGKIRNRLNKFTKNFSYTIEEITKGNIDEVHEFLKRWCLWRDCESDELLENERKAILYAMAHFVDLGLQGLALRINRTIQAIAIYEKMRQDTIVVHFEKGSPDFDGVYKAINMETAQRVRQTIPYINREEDLGVPGLRQAKLSYHPDHFVELYYVTKESLRSTTV